MMSAHRGGYETPGGLNRVLPGPQWAQIPSFQGANCMRANEVLSAFLKTGWVGRQDPVSRGAPVLRRMAQLALSRARK